MKLNITGFLEVIAKSCIVDGVLHKENIEQVQKDVMSMIDSKVVSIAKQFIMCCISNIK